MELLLSNVAITAVVSVIQLLGCSPFYNSINFSIQKLRITFVVLLNFVIVCRPVLKPAWNQCWQNFPYRKLVRSHDVIKLKICRIYWMPSEFLTSKHSRMPCMCLGVVLQQPPMINFLPVITIHSF